VSVLTNHGNGTFEPRAMYVAGSFTIGVRAADLDADGDLDLVTANSGSSTISVLRSCMTSGVARCFGDGSGTSCPCGNDSAPGSASGCLNSLLVGATLRGSGRATLTSDRLVLSGAQMPDACALYFQGTSVIAGGAGAVFGDGLRCVGGAVIRLGTQLNGGNRSQYPETGQPALSVKGAVTTPGERHYQVWYRNCAEYCTPSGFNLTNALSVTWFP
jgi:FG-GAP-like repeat